MKIDENIVGFRPSWERTRLASSIRMWGVRQQPLQAFCQLRLSPVSAVVGRLCMEWSVKDVSRSASMQFDASLPIHVINGYPTYWRTETSSPQIVPDNRRTCRPISRTLSNLSLWPFNSVGPQLHAVGKDLLLSLFHYTLGKHSGIRLECSTGRYIYRVAC